MRLSRSRVPGPDRAKGPGPGPLGPGAGAGTPWARGLGPRGPRCGIRVENVTTYSQASYLQSGKLPTVRQATYYQASYLLSGKATYSQAKLPTVRHAPNNRIHASNRAIDMHPKGIDMHPKVSIYFAPNSRILCTQPSHRHAPKRRRLCTQK